MPTLKVLIDFEPTVQDAKGRTIPGFAVVKCGSGFFSCQLPQELWSLLERLASGNAEAHSIPKEGLPYRKEAATPAAVVLNGPEPKRYTPRGKLLELPDDIMLDLEI